MASILLNIFHQRHSSLYGITNHLQRQHLQAHQLPAVRSVHYINILISATSSGSGPIWIESVIKPDWATITTNENARTAVLQGTPTVPGTYPVILTARTAYGESVTQNYTLTISDINIIRVSAYMRDEGIDEGNISKPRIYVKNLGTRTISDLRVEYYFTTESGKTPIVENYYIPKSTTQLVSLGYGNYKIVYNFAG